MSRIGMMLYGYCNGYFGRDSYEPKRIEAEGIDWIVVREESGRPNFATFRTAEEKDVRLGTWSREEHNADLS